MKNLFTILIAIMGLVKRILFESSSPTSVISIKQQERSPIANEQIMLVIVNTSQDDISITLERVLIIFYQGLGYSRLLPVVFRSILDFKSSHPP